MIADCAREFRSRGRELIRISIEAASDDRHHAHTLTNTGQEPLQYLVFSNQNTTDVCGYPDSNKFAFAALSDPSKWPKGRWVRKLIKDQPDVDYFAGEDTGESLRLNVAVHCAAATIDAGGKVMLKIGLDALSETVDPGVIE